MDNRKIYGNYIVGQGKDFKIKPNTSYLGSNQQIHDECWYVVDMGGKVIGMYSEHYPEFAFDLAKGLDDRYRAKIAEEMDKVLRSEDT